MLVFHAPILRKKDSIVLNDIKDVLSLFKHLILLQVLETCLQFKTCLILSNELRKHLHAFFSPAHGDEQISSHGLTFALHSEDKLLHFSQKLCIRSTAIVPSMHGVVALRVKVFIGEF